MHAALRLGSDRTDRIEHVYVEARPGELLIVFFVLPGGDAVDGVCARLVRRTLTALDPDASWTVQVGDTTDALAPPW